MYISSVHPFSPNSFVNISKINVNPSHIGSHLVFNVFLNDIPTQALTDGGAEVNVIDETFLRNKNLPIFKLDMPIKLLNADNSLNFLLE